MNTPIGVAPRLRLATRRLTPALMFAAFAGLAARVPYPTCPTRIVLGIPCPGCGLTRAGLAVAHLDFASAQHLSPLSVPLVVVTALMVLTAFVARDGIWKRAVSIVSVSFGVALLVVWALRFAGFFGGPVPI